MKQLTMTKVLTPIAALAFAFGVQAAAVSTETFDTYTAGASVTNETGWTFAPGADLADDASTVTAYESGTAPTGALLPDGVSAGANYLKLSTEDGILFRNIKGTATAQSVDINAGLFIDTDVQFTITDASDSPTNTVDAADKFVIWLEDQGTATNLCVLGHSFGATTSARTDKVYTLSPTNETLSIVPGEWHRLTVKAVSSFVAAGETLSYPAFQVYLDGVQLFATEFIADSGNQSALEIKDFDSFKGYFPARADSLDSLTQVGFSGEGAIDSVVVTHDVPGFEEPTVLTFTWDSAITAVDIGSPYNVTLTSSGSTLAVYPGQELIVTPTYNSGAYTVTVASDNACATVSDFTVTTVDTGDATIHFTATANNTVNVTFDWATLLSTLTAAGKVSDLTSVALTAGGTTTTYTLAQMQQEYITETTIDGLVVNDTVTVAVTFSTQSWRAFFSAAETDYVSTNGMVVTVIERPTSGATTVSISAEEAGPAVPEITPSASSETGATYTSAQADDIVNAINNNKSTYIKAPTGITDATYASKFVASKVEVNGSYKIVVALTSEAKTALQTDADAKAQTLAASLAGIAAGTVTEVSATGATPGFYYMVAYDTVVGGTYATKGTAGLASDAGAVTLTVPAKASGATAGFYKIVVVVEAN